MKIVPVPVLSDNYAYLLIDERSHEAAAVDPAEADKVLSAAQHHGVHITSVLTTHHHWLIHLINPPLFFQTVF